MTTRPIYFKSLVILMTLASYRFAVFYEEWSRREVTGEHAHTSTQTHPSKTDRNATQPRAAVRLRATRRRSRNPTSTYFKRRSSEVIRGVASRLGSLRGHVAGNRAGRTITPTPSPVTVRMFDHFTHAQGGNAARCS